MSEPRELTHEEIIRILEEAIPEVEAPIKEIRAFHTNILRTRFYFFLRSGFKIVPEGIDELIEVLRRRYEAALMKANTRVGMMVAEAVAGPVAQMALNSFHSIGALKTIAGSIQGIRGLITATKVKDRRKIICNIYFRDRNLSYLDIYRRKRKEMVRVSVGDLVKDYQITTNHRLDESWYNHFSTEGILEEDNYFLRLIIDVDKMYVHGITPIDLVSEIEAYLYAEDIIGIHMFYSPIMHREETTSVVRESQIFEEQRIESFLYLDIFANSRDLARDVAIKTRIESVSAPVLFYEQVFLPELDDLIVGGLDSIWELYPILIPVWSVIEKEVQTDEGWLIYLSRPQMMATGITIENVIDLMTTTGVNITGIDRELGIIITSASEESPGKIVNAVIDEEDGKIVKEEGDNREAALKTQDENEKIRLLIERPTSTILNKARLYYAQSEGGDLGEFLSRDDIDPTLTSCSDIHTIIEYFGIEAARNFIIKELYNALMMSGQKIDPRHIVLLADFMTHRGVIVGVGFSGVAAHSTSVIAKASTAKSMDIFQKASAVGASDDISGISAFVTTGKEPTISSDVIIDTKIRREFEREGRIKRIDPLDMEKTIDSIMRGIDPPSKERGKSITPPSPKGKEKVLPTQLVEPLVLSVPTGQGLNSIGLEGIAKTMEMPCLSEPPEIKTISGTLSGPSRQITRKVIPKDVSIDEGIIPLFGSVPEKKEIPKPVEIPAPPTTPQRIQEEVAPMAVESFQEIGIEGALNEPVDLALFF